MLNLCEGTSLRLDSKLTGVPAEMSGSRYALTGNGYIRREGTMGERPATEDTEVTETAEAQQGQTGWTGWTG